jgi:hypothetical protein
MRTLNLAVKGWSKLGGWPRSNLVVQGTVSQAAVADADEGVGNSKQGPVAWLPVVGVWELVGCYT